MVIGREANSDLPMVNKAGEHDFRDYPYPKAQPWHMAYDLSARCVGMSEDMLKNVCIRQNTSPLVFANAHKSGIKANADKDTKTSLRSQANDGATKHVMDVFSLNDLVSRVKLVLASGHELPQFHTSKQMIRQQCRDRNINLIEIPFFFMPNKRKIEAALTDVHREQIASIVSRFLG